MVPSPFPGMNPYLEHPALWPDVHHRLITAIADALAPALRPRYRVAIEKRTYLSEPEEHVCVGIPDVAVVQSGTAVAPVGAPGLEPAPEPVAVTVPMPQTIREGYLEVRETGSNAVVTVIELLSPANKRAGEGRRTYALKRQQVLSSTTHLVEIDLLRAGEPMPLSNGHPHADHRILVSHSERRPSAELYLFSVRMPIPPVPLPLQPGDPTPSLALQPLLNAVYQRAGYDLAIDYGRPPEPPLSEGTAVWANTLLHEKGLC